MLDVGQGDSIVLRTPAGKSILIDAGDGGTDVVPLLGALQVTTLDLVIASHPHADHIGGMDEVLSALPVKFYTDNGMTHTTESYESVMRLVESKDIQYRTAAREQVFNLDDGIKVTVLHPSPPLLSGTRSDLNANSVVVRVDHQEVCMLFTGDAEDPTENLLMSRGIESCEVLKVAHHGSNHSTSEAWLRAIDPNVALISVGRFNRYGHPGEETLARLASHDVQVYRTDELGSIQVTSDGKTVKVEPVKLAVHALAAVVPPAPDTAPGGSQPVGSQPVGSQPVGSQPVVPPPGLGVKVAPAPKVGDVAAAPACPFPASRSSEVFHEAGCGNAARISPQNQVCYPTREEALAAGKRSAGCCHP